MLLDGRNRAAACRLVGVEPTTKTYTGDDPVSFVVSSNIVRRHLTTGQRAMLALRVEPFYAEQAEARMLTGVRKSTPKNDPEADLPQGHGRAPQSRDNAAKVTGTSLAARDERTVSSWVRHVIAAEVDRREPPKLETGPSYEPDIQWCPSDIEPSVTFPGPEPRLVTSSP